MTGHGLGPRASLLLTACALLTASTLVAACGASEPEGGGGGAAPEGAGTTASAGGEAAAPDSLIVLVRADSVNRARLPKDWRELHHPRFDAQFLMPDPSVSPEARTFMEGVLLAEAARTGVADAGFDWLRRLDAVVLAYVEDMEDGIAAFRRGEVVVIALPSRMAGPLLSESWVVQAVMSSGAHPRWPADGPDESGGAAAPPRLPPQWLTTWRSEVRGTGLTGG